MPDDPQVALARAVAQIAELRRQLAAAEGDTAAAIAERDQMAAQVDTLRTATADRNKLAARVAELEPLLAEPPAASGVTLVHYLAADGATVEKRRYRATDGSKFKLLPDAMRRQAQLGIMAEGFTEETAASILARGEAVRRNLDLTKRASAVPAG